MSTVGILHPGEMGVAMAIGAAAGGADVLWTSAGRSRATSERAGMAGASDAGDLATLTSAADVVISVCPPDRALELARAVAATGFRRTFVDANAISPATAAEVDRAVSASGASYVDGGIIGAPASPRLLLTGQRADAVAALFGAPVTAVVLPHGGYAASAVKMAYAAWTKGTTALLLAIAATAHQLGIEDALAEEWAHSQPGLADRLTHSTASARKAWRWSGEMEEIARTLREAGQPDGFHLGAAELYRHLAPLKDDAGADIATVLDLLSRPSSPAGRPTPA